MSEKIYTPPPVEGYTDLSQRQVDLANKGKRLEAQVLTWLDEVEEFIRSQPNGNDRMRSRSISRTEIQTGFMWGIRAIFAPKRVELDP